MRFFALCAIVFAGLPACMADASAQSQSWPANEQHIMHKVCLAEYATFSFTSDPEVKRRNIARTQAARLWERHVTKDGDNAYARFEIAERRRTLCVPEPQGGFKCELSGYPCREVESCEYVPNEPCMTVELH